MSRSKGDLSGKYVEFTTTVPAIVQAEVVDDGEHGLVLRVDPLTVVVLPEELNPPGTTVRDFMAKAGVTSDDPRLIWIGQAVLPEDLKVVDKHTRGLRTGVVTVYVGNRVDAERKMTIGEIADGFWASPFADAEKYPWPIERAFANYLGANREDGGLGVTLDPEGISMGHLLRRVEKLAPQEGASA